MRFGNLLLNLRFFSFFFMCVFLKVILLIMFMGGTKLALGGGGGPLKMFAKFSKKGTALRAVVKVLRAMYVKILNLAPPVQNPEYAPVYTSRFIRLINLYLRRKKL